jgi:hypothetical protein
MDGTVRGTFDLNTPAKRKLRELRTEGAQTDAVMRQLGGTLDRLGGPEFDRRVRGIRDGVRSIGETATETRTLVGHEFDSMRRDIEESGRRGRLAIGELRSEMRGLSRERATPQIDMRGIARANAEVAALRANLAALSGQRATPRVAMGGGFAGGGGGGGGGGRGFEGSRHGGGLLDFGRRGLSPRSALIGAGLVFARPLLGAATGLVGSAGGAALGAGAVGAAGLGATAVGLGGVVAVAKPAMAGLKAVADAQKKYNDTVADYGRKSKEAARARRELSQAEHAAPGAIGLVREARSFQREWQQLTMPGRRALLGGARGFIAAGRRAAPNLAFNANRSSAAVATQGVNFGNFLAQRPTQQAITQLTQEFVRDLPYAERTLENIMLTFEHIAVAARPFFHDASIWTEQWTSGWESSTRNVYSTRREIGHLVGEFKDWRDLTGATFGLLRDIFQLGAPSGDSMVVSLTHTLDRWDEWIQRNPDKVRGFFRDAARDTSSLAGALVHVVGALNTIAQIIQPLLYRFTQLANIMGGAGLLLPTAARFALGSALGGRRGRGGGGGGFGFFGGGGGGPGGGRALGGLTTGAGAQAMLAPRFRGEAAMTGAGALDARSSGLLFLGGGAAATFGGRGRPGGIATPEAFRQRFGTVPGARYAGPVSQLGARPTAVQRARGAVGGAARGALRFAGPLIAIQAALGAATAPGGFDNKLSGAFNAATFGAFPGPAPAGTGGARASAYVQGLGQANTPAQMRRNLGQIRQHIGMLQGQLPNAVAGPLEEPLFGHKPLRGPMEEEIAALQRALRRGSADMRQYTRDLERQRHAQRVFSGEQRARTLSGRIGGTFRQFNRKEGPNAALEDTFQTMIGRFHTLGKSGSRVLASNMLQWGRDMARQNPALKGTVNDLAKTIEHRFERMGEHIRVINGRIYDGSRMEWRNIARAMQDPIEQAREAVTAGFTAIQRQAIASLSTMGFSASEARSIVGGMEAGGARGGGARSLMALGPNAQNLSQSADRAGQRAQQRANGKRARGGIIPGRGLMDTVPLPGGGIGAPGEAWIANRHTMRDLSRATVPAFGLTAEQVINGETRRHSQPMYALGGPQTRRQRRASVAAGSLAGLRGGIQSVAQQVLAQFPGLSVTSTTGGTHAKGSFHYRGMAVDLGGAGGVMNRAANWIAQHLGAGLSEGIHNPNLSVKDGRTVPAGFWGSKTWAEHLNHIHLAVAGGGGARGAAGLLGGLGAGRISLRGGHSGVGGAPGALADRAMAVYARGLQTRVNRRLGRMGGIGQLSGFAGGGDARANMALGRRMMLASGWDAGQWPALKALWTRESGWNTAARNPSSGAQGIPQALGHGDIGNTAAQQIGWGLRYIRGRYGSPSAAWGHEQSAGWYARGGRRPAWGGWNAKGGEFETRGPVIFGAGEKRRERVSIGAAGSSLGKGGHHIAVDMRGMVVSSDVDIDSIGDKVAQKILDAIDKAEGDA